MVAVERVCLTLIDLQKALPKGEPFVNQTKIN
jgi:hypothetical protein